MTRFFKIYYFSSLKILFNFSNSSKFFKIFKFFNQNYQIFQIRARSLYLFIVCFLHGREGMITFHRFFLHLCQRALMDGKIFSLVSRRILYLLFYVPKMASGLQLSLQNPQCPPPTAGFWVSGSTFVQHQNLPSGLLSSKHWVRIWPSQSTGNWHGLFCPFFPPSPLVV